MAEVQPRTARAAWPAPGVSRPLPWARRRAWRTLRRGSGLFNLAFLALVVIGAVFAPQITRYDPAASEVTQRLQPPGWLGGASRGHLLGTDQLGRDVFARLSSDESEAVRIDSVLVDPVRLASG